MIFEKDSWKEIWDTVNKNRLRTVLTCFGVFWGIFMLVVMVGSGNGLRTGILSEFEGSATNSFFIWTQKTTKPYKGMKPGRNYNFTNEDYLALQEVRELKTIVPMNQLGRYQATININRGTKSTGGGVMGVGHKLNQIEQVKMTEGRWLNPNDEQEKRKVVVIGKRIREVLFDKEKKVIGEYISVNGVYFQVIGFTEPTGSGGEAEEKASAIYIPFSTFQQAYNYGNVIGWFALSSQDGVPATEAEAKVIALLKERHKVAPEDEVAVGHWNMEKQYKRMSGLFNGIEGLVWIVGTGTLLAGIIGVSNIMLIIVKERTREIGVKRAIGATPSHITGQIVLESIALTALAGYLGLVLSVLLLELVSGMIPDEGGNAMFRNPGIDLSVALTALGILIAAGAVAGLIPARKAIAVSPVEALRSE